MAEKFVESDIDDDSSDDDDDEESDFEKTPKEDENENDSDIDDDIDDDDDEFNENENNDKMDTDSGLIDFSDDESDVEDNHNLQKFNDTLKQNVILTHHPELILHNHHEVEELCLVIRNEDGTINDPRHRTVPFITKYERAKILGERAKQINAGATPFVEVNQEIIDGYSIALAEFEQKKIPMIIRRPLPNNQSEYWRLEDLEFI